MNVDFKAVNEILVARILDPRLDAYAAADLKQKVGGRIDQGARRIVLDLSAVDFVDSTGLGAILSLLKRASPAGNLVLCGCHPPVLELLKLTRLDRVFHMFATQAEALGGFN